jgi:hypothetical protein
MLYGMRDCPSVIQRITYFQKFMCFLESELPNPVCAMPLFTCLLLVFHKLLKNMALGTKKLFRCSWWFCRFDLITNIETVLYLAKSVLPSASQKIPCSLWNPESSLPCSQQPATYPYSETDEWSSHYLTHFSNIYFNIILPFMPRSSKWSPIKTYSAASC